MWQRDKKLTVAFGAWSANAQSVGTFSLLCISIASLLHKACTAFCLTTAHAATTASEAVQIACSMEGITGSMAV